MKQVERSSVVFFPQERHVLHPDFSAAIGSAAHSEKETFLKLLVNPHKVKPEKLPTTSESIFEQISHYTPESSTRSARELIEAFRNCPEFTAGKIIANHGGQN